MAENILHQEALSVLELNHVALYVSDLSASVRFYSDVLGLPSLKTPEFGYAVAWFSLGSQELHLIESTNKPTQDKNQQSHHMALSVKCAVAAAETLRERGISEMRGPAPRPDGAVQVFLHDPDGYLLELISKPL